MWQGLLSNSNPRGSPSPGVSENPAILCCRTLPTLESSSARNWPQHQALTVCTSIKLMGSQALPSETHPWISLNICGPTCSYLKKLQWLTRFKGYHLLQQNVFAKILRVKITNIPCSVTKKISSLTIFVSRTYCPQKNQCQWHTVFLLEGATRKLITNMTEIQQQEGYGRKTNYQAPWNGERF